MDESWKLYNVYFELNCPFDYEHLENALVNDNDIRYDGMDFMVTDKKKANVYGYWFFVRTDVIPSFEDYLHETYRDNLLTSGVQIDYANFIVRRSSSRSAYKKGQYCF